MSHVPTCPGSSVPHIPMCPKWCEGEHGEPGGGADADGLHHYGMARDLRFEDITNAIGGRMLRRGGTSIDLILTRHDLWNACYGLPLLEMSVQAFTYSDETGIPTGRDILDLHLTGGEARTLARALERLADVA